MAKRPRRQTQPERVGGLASKAERAQALETIARAFTRPQHLEGHMLNSLWTAPIFDPEHTRVVVAEGRVVSTVVLGPRTVRFGPVAVPAMTVGPVATHDHYRKQNFASLAMADASRHMREHGVLVAYLQGIPNFYHRFGYYPFLAWSSAKFDRGKAASESLPGRLRRMTRKDLPDVRRLYDAASRNRICTAKRDDAVWNWLISRGTKTWLFASPKVILDQGGHTIGYVTSEPRSELRISEIVIRQDERGCRAALGALVREAKRQESKQITLDRIPWDDSLAVFLRQYVDAEFTLRSHATGGPLMLVVDFPRLMRELAPLFSQRGREACTRLPRVRFNFETDGEAVGLTVSRSGVTVGRSTAAPTVRVPRRWLSGLLTGYYSVDDVALRKGAKVPRDLKPVLDILFPKGWPFVYKGDDY